MSATTSVHFSRLKVLLILEGPGAAVLTHTLRSGTDNTSNTDLYSYLRTLPSHSTAPFTALSGDARRKAFDASQKKQIRNNPSWANFDVSLLYKAITLACEDVAPRGATAWQDPSKLEYLITEVKNERNDVIHERPSMTEGQYQAKVTQLQNLFVNILREVQVRYNVHDTETRRVQNQVMSDIQSIKSVFDPDSMWREWSSKLLPVFIDTSRRRLEGLYQSVQSFDPLCFLGDPGEPRPRVPVQTIFTKLLVKTSNHELDCRDVLTLMQPPPQGPPAPTLHGQQLPSSQQSTLHAQPGQQPLHIQHSLTHTLPGQSPPRPVQLLVVSGVAGTGKSTFLNYILSEFVLNEPNCSVKHLESYDLVLRLLCRERHVSSLKEYVHLVLPESKMMEKDALDLLKCCKILFLIDGLDEANASSKQVVDDVVKLCKVEPNFSALITSRPESVQSFLITAPHECGKLEAHIQGIHPSDRTAFVLKHYECLAPDGTNDTVKVSRLRGLMADIGWKEHFGLPLNLLFLSLIFIDDAERITNTYTQTSLCLTMHEWCVAKMRQRLVIKGVYNRDTFERGVERVLAAIYEVAFTSLLEGRLSCLSAQDEDKIRACCRQQELPYPELMGAFFSLRKSVENRVLHETYSAPHKGVLEFYAARHILEQLHAGNTNITDLLLNSSGRRSGRAETFREQRNLLLHVAGLLSQGNLPSIPRAIVEVVDLLAEGGVKRCNEWLSLLAETEVNESVLRRVAEQVHNSGLGEGEAVSITDSRVCSAVALLPLLPHKKIHIELERESGEIDKLYGVLARHTCKRLVLRHHYMRPGQAAASGALLSRLPDSTNLKVFHGKLDADHVRLLPQSLTQLRLAVTSQHEVSALQHVLQYCPNLAYLVVHVTMAAPTSLSRTPLPQVTYGVSLLLSKVTDENVDLAAETAAALCPRGRGYTVILFPAACVSVDGYKRLFRKAGEHGVKVEYSVRVPERNTTREDKEELDPLVNTQLGCSSGVYRDPEEQLWGMLWGSM